MELSLVISAYHLLIGGVTLLLVLGTWRRYWSPISHIPGHLAASFTRLWHMHRILKGDQNTELIRLHEKHGHFVRISYDEVSVSHPDAIKKALLAPLEKAPWYKALAIPDYRFQSAMSITEPKQKMERSKRLAPGYALSNVIKSETAIDETVSMFLDWLNVVGEVTFSRKFGFLEQGIDVGNSIKNSMSLNAYITVAAYLRWLHVALLANPLVTWLAILPMGHLFNTTRRAVDERQQSADARWDILASWLQQMRQYPDHMDMNIIHTQATSLVGAGSGTVSSALQSFVYHMIRHPTAWNRVRGEIDAASRAGRCQDRVISFKDAKELPFLQACIKEATRVFSPVPMGLPRLAPKEGVTIGHETFPSGTILSVNPWVIHHSRELWGPDASQFNPDRWITGNVAEMERYWMPFGAGYNSCPGQHVTKIEMSKVAATIVRDYDICQARKDQTWKWKAYFTVVPHSWPCLIKRRDSY
ncbi:cytochrome P450 [Apiospora marii]|uniref:Cytochrome P450 n=1 Tax=Apiospora marii TaxID=335849 RepID=A0ABR1SVI9_9PEZI